MEYDNQYYASHRYVYVFIDNQKDFYVVNLREMRVDEYPAYCGYFIAYHNQRAFALYQAVGFTISGYNMSKNISM